MVKSRCSTVLCTVCTPWDIQEDRKLSHVYLFAGRCPLNLIFQRRKRLEVAVKTLWSVGMCLYEPISPDMLQTEHQTRNVWLEGKNDKQAGEMKKLQPFPSGVGRQFTGASRPELGSYAQVVNKEITHSLLRPGEPPPQPPPPPPPLSLRLYTRAVADTDVLLTFTCRCRRRRSVVQVSRCRWPEAEIVGKKPEEEKERGGGGGRGGRCM